MHFVIAFSKLTEFVKIQTDKIRKLRKQEGRKSANLSEKDVRPSGRKP